MTVLAFGVRRVGIGFGVPLWEEGDNHIPAHVELLRKGRASQARRVDNIQYPSFLARVVSWLPAPELDDPAGATLDEHLATARGTNVQVRTFILLLALTAIPGTYLLGRRFMSRGWSLFAAALIATSLLHLNFSQQSRPHAAFASLLLWTMLASLHLRRTPTAGAYLLAGSAAALAAGCLHSGWMAVLPIAAAVLWRERAEGTSRWFEPRVLLAAIPLVAAIPIFYTFLFQRELMEEKQVLRFEDGTFVLANHKLNSEMFDLHSGFEDIAGILWRWDPLLLPLLGLALGAFVVTRVRGERVAAKQRGDLWVLLAFALPYLLLIGSYTRTFERFLLPIYPLLACFLAWGASRVVAALAVGLRPAVVGALVLALAVPAYSSTRWSFVRARPDTFELAGAWVRANVPPETGAVFVTSAYDLPLARPDVSFRKENGKLRAPLYTVWSRYLNRLEEHERPAPLYDVRAILMKPGFGDLTDPEVMDAFLASFGPGVFVVEVTSGARASRIDPVLRAGLAARGTLEARFAPDPDPYFSDHPLVDEDEEVADWPDVFPRILRAHACGPVVEVYRVE